MIEAWHFVCDDRKLRDGTPLEIGKRLVHDGPLVLCESGYHASEKIIDALQYAPGSVACRVQCDGEILRDTDKLVCRERTAIWALDATDMLRAFARRCALDVIHLWDAPQVVRDYLTTGDESLRAAAWAAAGDAARAAASAAARAAVRAAAWAAWAAVRAAAWAAWAAARDAASDAASAAARDAARDAAWNAAWAAVRDTARDAAWAAWAAVRDTARDAARARYELWLVEMVTEAHEKEAT